MAENYIFHTLTDVKSSTPSKMAHTSDNFVRQSLKAQFSDTLVNTGRYISWPPCSPDLGQLRFTSAEDYTPIKGK
jgi:hypothetical protein